MFAIDVACAFEEKTRCSKNYLALTDTIPVVFYTSIGWPKMHQRWRTFRHSCSSRFFLQVGEENALKRQKSWWLGVAPGFAVWSLIYLMDIREKWHILIEVIFDPSNCLENMNKHRKTIFHIPMLHQAPKELFSGYHGLFKVQKIWSKCSILVLFGSLVGHWDMKNCFPMFVHVFRASLAQLLRSPGFL